MDIVDGADAVVELVKDLREALEIVKAKAHNRLSLELRKAEIEVEIATTNITKVGGRLDIGISLEASIQKERSHNHVLTLTLEPTSGGKKLGWEETHDLADSIVALAELRNRVAKLGVTDLKVGDLVLAVHVGRNTSGGLQLVGGGEGA